MGIDLTCGKEFFSTSYSGWNTLRMKFAEYCMKFIEDLSKNELNISPDGVIYAMPDKEIIRERVIIESRDIMKEWNNIVEAKKTLNIIDYLNIYGEHIDYLINIGLYGIVSLLDKSDCDGLYSVGNSIDIINMLNIVNNMNIIEEKYIEIINKLKKVFQKSINKKKVVVIA
jgi:hypothetical protein